MNDCKRVIDLMSYPSSHHAHGGKPRRGFNLLLHLLSRGQVQKGAGYMRNDSILFRECLSPGIKMMNRTISPKNAKLAFASVAFLSTPFAAFNKGIAVLSYNYTQ